MRRKSGFLLMASGGLLLLAALALTVYNIWDMNRAAQSAAQITQQLTVSYQEKKSQTDKLDMQVNDELPDYILAPNMKMPEMSVDGEKYIGILEIPELNLTLPVASDWSYPLLKNTPCRYSGSAYTDNLVIAAHNYDRHFGNLKNLHLDDEIYFTDADGNVFRYAVSEFEILPPTAVEDMTSDCWGITLFTCTLGGQDRITVRAVRMDA